MSVESLNSCNPAIAFWEALNNNIYSASVVDNDTMVYLYEVQDIAPLFAKKT